MAKYTDYIVIDKNWLKNRIEEYHNISIEAFRQDKPDPDHEGILRDELSDVLANSKPLLPLVKHAFESGTEWGIYVGNEQNDEDENMLDQEQYLNRKIEI